MPNGVRLLVRLIVGLAFAGALTWIAWKLGGRPWALVAVLIATPTVAWLISRPLIECIHEGFTWISNRPYEKWEGNYYEFAGVQVRVFVDAGQLWFAAPDVIKAAGIAAQADRLLAIYPGGAQVLERLTCLNMATLEKFLATHRSPETGRLLLWAQREVVAPWERKK